jgi:hypothetical protein
LSPISARKKITQVEASGPTLAAARAPTNGLSP